ncbi:MAG: sulfatase-like hydrolase/transferase [Candidatus Latescibacteria bacterium]|nr:sulfatase-like hydrolase/transferase [Candidatus Latescibacterota bacterium]
MADRPNIVFITADHLRYDTLGCTGDPVIQTPGIDRLASEGTSLSRFFVQNPVCAPSRATFMTGRYPRHHGVKWNGSSLSENEMTMVEFFKSHGYATACVGKSHVGQKRFRESLDHVEANGIRRDWSDKPGTDYTVTNPNPFEQYVRDRGFEYRTSYALPNFRANLGAVPSDLPDDCHLDSYVGMKSIEYLQDVKRDQPFFLWVGFYGPHHPYVPSGRFARMYDPDSVPPFHRSADDLEKKPAEYRLYFDAETHKYRGFRDASDETFRGMKAAYYGMVSQLDWQLGLILDTLKERDLEEDTIVVFLSDHGEFLGDHCIPAKAPFLLDCMLHVPCILRIPGGRRGVSVDDLTESVDLFPALASLTGLETPECVQGQNLSPAVTSGQGAYQARDLVYAEAVDKRCIRTRDWKLIHYPGKPWGELYHLADDPHELNNVYDERPDVRDRMRLDLYRLLDETEDFRHPGYSRFTGRDPESGEEITHYLTW